MATKGRAQPKVLPGRSGRATNSAAPQALQESVARLQERCDQLAARNAQLEELVERVLDALAAEQWRIVDGYLVHLTPDPESDGWVASCPTVKCTGQGRDDVEALASITDAVASMIGLLAEMGVEIPAPDVGPQA